MGSHKTLLTLRNAFFDVRAENGSTELPEMRVPHDLKLNLIEVPWQEIQYWTSRTFDSPENSLAQRNDGLASGDSGIVV